MPLIASNHMPANMPEQARPRPASSSSEVQAFDDDVVVVDAPAIGDHYQDGSRVVVNAACPTVALILPRHLFDVIARAARARST
jgi:hypothetical protein